MNKINDLFVKLSDFNDHSENTKVHFSRHKKNPELFPGLVFIKGIYVVL